jgi:hypothetical protein
VEVNTSRSYHNINSLYDQQKSRPTFQKAWEDKKKFKVDQRKKGSKPPFFRNNPQGQQTPRDPRTIEVGVKGQGNHLFNVGVVKEIICSEIVLTEVKK